MSTVISVVHAAIAGCGALYVQVTEPDLFYKMESMIFQSSETARLILLFSLSYFIYDCLDMLLWTDYSGTN